MLQCNRSGEIARMECASACESHLRKTGVLRTIMSWALTHAYCSTCGGATPPGWKTIRSVLYSSCAETVPKASVVFPSFPCPHADNSLEVKAKNWFRASLPVNEIREDVLDLLGYEAYVPPSSGALTLLDTLSPLEGHLVRRVGS